MFPRAPSGPLLFLLYINELTNVSRYCFSIFFAADTNMFISRRNIYVLCKQLNVDLREISLNVLKTHYMIFTPRYKDVEDTDV